MKNFTFTAVADQNTSSKIIDNIEYFDNKLNANINLSDFTQIVNQILFVWICSQPNNSILRPDNVKFVRKTNTIQIVTNIDYLHILNSNNIEVLNAMKKSYLKGIEKLKNKKEIKNDLLLQKIENIFID